MEHFPITRIVIADQCASSPLAVKARKAWPDAQTVIVDDPAREERRFDMEADPLCAGKRTLVLAPNKGRFIRKCPGTSGMICCDYRVIDLAEGCALDCSYCVLQGYLTDRRIRLATNLEDLERELDNEIAGAAPRRIRMGTGELSDSLMFENELGLGQALVDMFGARPTATLELKTKTDNISGIIAMPLAKNVVLAWSLNRPEVIAADEKGAVSLDDRLKSAGQAVRAGWRVAFHFDPLVMSEGWQAGYAQVVEKMFNATGPDAIAWISLGALRFAPSLKQVIRERFPATGLLNGEFALCPDNKMRYVKPLRRKLFSSLREAIHRVAPDVPVYLCMEGVETWQSVFGYGPGGCEPLRRVFG